MKNGFFRGRQVVVMGLGRFGGGADSARFACRQGANVIVTDLASPEKLRWEMEELRDCEGIEYRLGGHRRRDFKNADVVIVNPAVAPGNEYVQIARQNGAKITSQIEIFFQRCSATIVGVTGSNGKSTTTALTAHLLKTGEGGNFRKVWLGGNIGGRALLCELDRISADDVVVLEISSFQLEQLKHIGRGPAAAVLTNVTPNHLDRHKTFEAYRQAKELIFSLQDTGADRPAAAFFNADDEICRQWFEKYRVQAGRECFLYSADDVAKTLRRNFGLPGRANLQNLAAASAVAGYFGVTAEQMAEAIGEFRALPHRLEFVTERDGVKWYNDSIATTPESAIAALRAFAGPVVIIAGGYDKGLDFGELGREIALRAKAAVVLGQTADAIAEAIEKGSQHSHKPIVRRAGTLAEAAKLAGQVAESGDVVVLSPACASYDMFENFQQRGEYFRKLVTGSS